MAGNDETLHQAAVMGRVKKFVSMLTPAGLRTAVKEARGLTEQLPSWGTPCQWIDDDGMFFGADGAWVYYQLPAAVFAGDGQVLDQLLTDLYSSHGERDTHLDTFGWEERATPGAQGTSEADDYVTRSLRMLVPAHLFVIGVKLVEDTDLLKVRASVRNVFVEVVDRALAEWIPSLDTYKPDLAAVAATLSGYGGTPASGAALNLLESWYTLGVSDDVKATERDDHIVIGSSVIELASVRSFQDSVTLEDERFVDVATPLAAGDRGVTVVSARGVLTQKTRRATGGEESVACLGRASVIVGRRSHSPTETLESELSRRPRVEFKRLPLRQLPALDETLPTSTTRCEPGITRLDAARLSTLGFQEPLPAGDREGLLVGLVDPGLAYPLLVDVLRPGAFLDVAGSAGSGKTFLVDHLAWQAVLSHRKVTVLCRSAQNTPLAGRATVVSTPVAGLLDPMAHLVGDARWQVASGLLGALLPDLTDDDQAAVAAGLRQAASADLSSLGAAVRLFGEPRLIARALKALQTPHGRLVNATDPTPVRRAVRVWELDSILAPAVTAGLGPLFENLACAVALSTTPGGLVVADEVGAWATSGLAAGAFDRLPDKPGLIVATSDLAGWTQPGRLRATHRVLLAAPAREAAAALSPSGVTNLEDLTDWLADSGPVLDDSEVLQPAGGFLIEPTGRISALIVGPVPAEDLPRISRGSASRYYVR